MCDTPSAKDRPAQLFLTPQEPRAAREGASRLSKTEPITKTFSRKRRQQQTSAERPAPWAAAHAVRTPMPTIGIPFEEGDDADTASASQLASPRSAVKRRAKQQPGTPRSVGKKTTQLHINCGQSDFDVKICRKCGWVFTPGAPCDEREHARQHSGATQGISAKGLRTEQDVRAVTRSSDSIATIGHHELFVADLAEGQAPSRKLQEVSDVVSTQLGLPEGWLLSHKCKVYTCVMGEQIVGVAVAQEVRKAFPAAVPSIHPPAAAEPAASSSCSPPAEVGGTQADVTHFAAAAERRLTPAQPAATPLLMPLASAAPPPAEVAVETPTTRRRSMGQANTMMRYLTAGGGTGSSGGRLATPKRTPSGGGAMADVTNTSAALLPLQPSVTPSAAPLLPASSTGACPRNRSAAAEPATPTSANRATQAAQDAAIASAATEPAGGGAAAEAPAAGLAHAEAAGQEWWPSAAAAAPAAAGTAAQQCAAAVLPRRRSLLVGRGGCVRGCFAGVRLVWVSSEARRRGIAGVLLDAIRGELYPAYLVGPQDVAFSQPTHDGVRFAQAYTGRPDLWVYDV